MRRSPCWLVLVASAAVVLASCSSDAPKAQDESGPQETTTTRPAPTSIQRSRVVLDLSGDTSTEAPIAGLVGIALSTKGDQLYTLSNTLDGALTLRVFPYEPDAQLSPADGRVVMRIPHPYIHSGGGLVARANGDLDVSVGALEFAGEPRSIQNPDGVVVRIPAAKLRDGGGTFTPTRGDLLARGLRNPWRMTADRTTGDLWIGDVGDGTAEEIDRIPADQQPGSPLNFGFPYVEGDTPLIDPPPDSVELTQPEWFHGRGKDPRNTMIGGYVYRGKAFPDLVGWYVMTDFAERKVRAYEIGTTRSDSTVLTSSVSAPTAFAEDPDGELYLINADGTFFKMIPGTQPGAEHAELQYIGSIWNGPSEDSASEATGLLVEPDGKALLGAERGGRVVRIVPDAPQLASCAIDQTTIPQYGHTSGAELKKAIETKQKDFDTYASSFPNRLQPDIDKVQGYYAELTRLGTAKGWDDPELIDIVVAASYERGPMSDLQRSEQTLLNYVIDRC